ncbi:MAG TPA: hypothetical protein PLA85_01870 [Micropepsaceae bacterium]|nr:hypothetical protein [Micropepsaceae bacterium]
MRFGLTLMAAAVAAAAGFIAPDAQADDIFTDCNGEKMRAATDMPASFSCVEMHRQQLTLGNFAPHIRTIRDAATDPGLLALYDPEAEEAVVKAFQTWAGFRGTLGWRNVTIILHSPEFQAPVKAFASADTDTMHHECVINVYLSEIEKAPPADVHPNFLFTMAHEAFHCVQAWNWSASYAHHSTTTKWWVEGSADFMASTVFPNTATSALIYQDFDKNSESVPLTQMSYETGVFFTWLWGKDPALFWSMLDGLPSGADSGDEQAQQASLRKTVGEERFQEFAQDYVDGNIIDPHGKPLGVHPVFTSTVVYSDTGDREFLTQPFTVMRRVVRFERGQYMTATKAAKPPLFAARPLESTGGWGPFPDQISPGCEGDESFVVASMPVENDRTQFTLSGINMSPCPKTCLVQADEIEQCLVGRWKVDPSMHMSLMTIYMTGEMRDLTLGGDIFVTFNKEGTVFVEFSNFFFSGITENAGMDIKIMVEVDGTDQGIWSASGDRMAWCPKALGVQFKSTVTLPNMSPVTQPFQGYMQNAQYEYTCDGDVAWMTFPTDDVDFDPRWRLHRVQ